MSGLTNEPEPWVFARCVACVSLHAALIALGVLACVRTVAAVDLPLTFSTPVNVSRTATFSQAPAMAAGGAGSVFVLWEEMGGWYMPLSRSTDAAETFSDIVLVAPGDWDLSFGQVRVASAGVDDVQAVFTSFDLVYGGAEIVHVGSRDGGNSFQEPKVISWIDGVNSYAADVASGWAVVAAWSSIGYAGGATIELSFSQDGGVSFSLPQRIDTSNGDKSSPAVGVYGPGDIYVAWVENVDPLGAIEGFDVFFTRSTDGGVTFLPPVNLSNSAEKSWPPRMAVDDAGTIYLVWPEGDFTFDEKLLFSFSLDRGTTFSEPLVLAGPTGWVEGRIAAAGDGAVWVAWNAGPPGSEPAWQSSVVRSLDGGFSFSDPAPLRGLSDIASSSSEQLFVTWSETLDGEQWPDVFVSRGETITCGDADVDGKVTATDALLALQASVGVVECAECRCDVNAEGTVSATDVLAILRAAVGQPVTLACPSC